MDGTGVLALAALAIVVLMGLAVWSRRRNRRDLGTPADRATFATLHTASLASPPLRAGLTTPSAERAIRHLRTLLGTTAVALTDGQQVLAWTAAATTTPSRWSSWLRQRSRLVRPMPTTSAAVARGASYVVV